MYSLVYGLYGTNELVGMILLFWHFFDVDGGGPLDGCSYLGCLPCLLVGSGTLFYIGICF